MTLTTFTDNFSDTPGIETAYRKLFHTMPIKSCFWHSGVGKIALLSELSCNFFCASGGTMSNNIFSVEDNFEQIG